MAELKHTEDSSASGACKNCNNHIREKLVDVLTESFDAQYNQRQLITPVHTADNLIRHGVTVQEQGQWTENQHTTYDSTWGEDVYWYTYTCSVCGGEAMNNFDYCPFCGNPMLPQPPKGE